jgi:phenylacetate-CoA ligase
MGPLRRFIARRVAYPLALTVKSVRQRTGFRPMRLLRRLQELSRSEPRAWQAFRDDQLRRCLVHALEHIPFYRPLASRLVPIACENPMAALQEYPVHTKCDHQEREDELLADRVPPGGRQPGWTSGSTGQPTKYWHDRRGACLHRLASFRDKMYVGWRPGDPGALIEIPTSVSGSSESSAPGCSTCTEAMRRA